MWAAIAATVAATISAIVGIIQTNKTNDANRENVELTNQTNRDLAAQAQEFNASEAEKSFEREKELMDMQHQFNSPMQAVKDATEAGLNPSVYMAGKLGSGVSMPSTPTATSPTLPSMIPFQKDANIPFNIATGVSDSFLKMANAIKAFKEAKKTGVESEQLGSMLEAQIKNLNTSSEGQELSNMFLKTYGDSIHKSQIDQNLASITMLSQQALTLASQGKLNESNAKLSDIEGEMKKAQTKLYGEQSTLLKQQNETFMTELRARIDNLQSQSSLNRSQALTEDELRSYRKGLLSADREVAMNTAQKVRGEIEKLLYSNQIQSFLTIEETRNIAHNLAKQIELDTKSKDFDNSVIGRILRFVGAPVAGQAARGASDLLLLMAK